MQRNHLLSFVVAGFIVATVPSCDLDVPDLNNPSIDELEDNPTAVTVNAATTGLLIGNRRNHAAANGYVAQFGILGREAYNFDSADPRFIDEVLERVLNPGSPFGGNFWTLPYSNIRLANIILGALDKVPDADLPPTAKAGIEGFVYTIQALDLLEIINARDDIGAVIDTNRPVGGELAPIVDKPVVFARIAELLDRTLMVFDANPDAIFSFQIDPGYADFNTPATFRRFNRAVKARVAAYMEDYGEVIAALGASFIDDAEPLDLDAGAYYTYTTKSGDVTNALINPNFYVHPSITSGAQQNGTTLDTRLTRKTRMVMSASAQSLSSSFRFTLYPDPDSRVSLIRNEELLLLKAEAQFFIADAANDNAGRDAAVATLNLVRRLSGGLEPLVGTPNETLFTDQLLYERKYSLLFEGHRWIDVRRFNRIDTLPVDKTTMDMVGPPHVRSVRYPLPQGECNARRNEARCMMTSVRQ